METWKEFFFFYLFCHLISSLYNIFLYSILASVCISIQQVKKNKNKNTGYTGNRARGFSTWFLCEWTVCWTLLCLQAPWAPWLIGRTWLLQLCGLPWTSPCCRYLWGTFFTQPLLLASRHCAFLRLRDSAEHVTQVRHAGVTNACNQGARSGLEPKQT